MNEVQRLEMIKKSRDLVKAGAFTQEEFVIIKRRIICEKPILFKSSLGVIKQAKDLLDRGVISPKEYDVAKRQFLSDRAVVDFGEILKYKGLLDRQIINDEEYAFLKAKLISDPKFKLDFEKIDSIEKERKSGVLRDDEYKYLKALVLSGSKVNVNIEAIKAVQNAYNAETLSEEECKSLRCAIVQNKAVPSPRLLGRIADYKVFLDQGIITASEYEVIRQRLLQDMPLPPITGIEGLKSYKQLLDQGAINKSDYDEQKKNVLPEAPKKSYDFSYDELRISRDAITIDNIAALPIEPESIASEQGGDDKKRLKIKGKHKPPLKIIIPCGVALVLLIAFAGLFVSKSPSEDGTIVGHKYVDSSGNFLIFNSEDYCIRSVDEEPFSTTYKIVSDSEDGKPYIEIEGWAYSEKFFINETNQRGTPTVLEYDFEPGWTFELDEENSEYQAIIIDDAKYQKLIDIPAYAEDIMIHGRVYQDLGEECYFVTSNGENENIIHVYAPDNSLGEGDICTIKGKMNGIYTYTNKNDESRTVPSMIAEKVEDNTFTMDTSEGNSSKSDVNNVNPNTIDVSGGAKVYLGDSFDEIKDKVNAENLYRADPHCYGIENVDLYGCKGATLLFFEADGSMNYARFVAETDYDEDLAAEMYEKLVVGFTDECGTPDESDDYSTEWYIKEENTTISITKYGSDVYIMFTVGNDLEQ